MERRLATILAADVVGYSRLMGGDEEATLATLNTYREVIDKLVVGHRGRVFGSAGDSLIAEFASPVEAVRCAIEIQQEIETRNADLLEDRRMRFRIGINLGDVMAEGDNLFGDGVNIAARLEALCEDGGVALSGNVHEQVQDKLDERFEDAGEQELKNIARPIRIWRWSEQVTDKLPAAPPVTEALPLPDKPSIAVLPFTNMSGDPEQEYFSDGVTEEIITSLAKIRSLFVIGRNSSFALKGQKTDARFLGENLGVNYILQGSIRKAQNNVRITGQLIDCATGEHLWADRFEGTFDDIFGLQDVVTTQVIAAVAPTVRAAEIVTARRKGTDNVSAYDLYLQAVARLYETDTDSAIPLLSRAREVSPTFSPAYGLEAWSRTLWAQMSHFPEFSQNRDIAVDLARKALRLGDSDPELLGQIGYALAFFEENVELGFKLVAEALEAAPSLSWLWASQGYLHMYYRDSADAVAAFEMARQLDPRNPLSFRNNLGMVGAKILLSDFAGGLDFALEAYELAPENLTVLRWLAACYSGLDAMDKANFFANEAIRLDPSFRISTFVKNHPIRHAKNYSIMRNAMIKAGIPV